MSARTPFFLSGGRQPQQESLANCDHQDVTQIQFLADKSNSLNQDTLTDCAVNKGDTKASNDPENKLPAETDVNDARFKPLNVNGLIRSRTHSKPSQRILVNGNNVPRPGTADPTRESQQFNAHTSTIAAPTPFKASRIVPPLLMNNSNLDISSRPVSPFSFKTPSLLPVSTNEDSFANNAHIPAEARGSSHVADISGRSRSINGLSNRSMPSRMLDRNSVDVTNGSGLANGSKRRKPEAENGGRSEQHQKHPKRFKADGASARVDKRVDRPDQEHIHSRNAEQVSDFRQWEYDANRSGDLSGNASGIDGVANGALAYHDTEAGQQNFTVSAGALDRLLGRDVNAYVEEHLVEKYEQAVTRWRESTLEQWFAGAEEIKSKYSKIFEFVQSHINTKIALYASLDKKIEQHESIVAAREEMLSGVQARMVKEGEGILGRSLGM